MPSRHRLLSVFTTTLLPSLVVHLPIATPSGMDAAMAKPANSEDQKAEADRLFEQGVQQFNQGQTQAALETFQKELAIRRAIGDRQGEWRSLSWLGGINQRLGQYESATEQFQQALEIAQEIGDRQGEGTMLNNIGSIYDSLGQYAQALDYYQQSLSIAQEIGDRYGEGGILNNIGFIYRSLGQYAQALDYYQQSLSIAQEIGDRQSEGRQLNNIGGVYQSQGQYAQALDYYQQSLSVAQEIGGRYGEGVILNNIGGIHDSLGQYAQALDYYQQSLSIRQEIGDRQGEGTSLNNIGGIYYRLEEYAQALDCFQQSLSIRQEIGDRSGEANTLGNLGYLLQAQNQPELAIVFYKQSVNRYETIRDSNRSLSQELQETYTGTIEDTYRTLADLLLQQDRILEAQQVLDLLKVQELDDYLRGVRGIEDRLTILQPEQEILNQYNELQQTAIEIGQELAGLRQRLYQGETLTEAETQRVDELEALQEAINNDFSQFVDRKEIQDLVAQLSPRVVQQNIDLVDLAGLQDDLTRLNAVLLYPLILDDRLELILTTPNAPPLRRVVDVSKADLTRLISDLRLALRDPNSDPTPLAQQLYRYLIEPIAADLAQVKASLPDGQTPTIIYAPDAALRYIPLAVLHDGQQWLVQSYRINNITAKSFTEFQSEPVSHPRVLAGAFADETISYRVAVGDQEEEFRGLPHAGEEVASLIATSPGIPPLLDRNFSWTTVRRYLGASDIVHFATHAAFVPGTPEDSFILFGNGDRAVLECLTPPASANESLSCINNWSFANVDLVVLSACETGLSGELSSDATGEEILGLGYQFQNRGARAVVASLWKVSDGGTQALMNAFYAALQQDGITKSEAIRQAQIALITGDYTALEDESRGIVELRQRIEANVSPDIASHLSHPYYWAPFILIGNGL